MRNAAVALRKIRDKMEEVYATGDKKQMNETLPDLIALWMLTIEEASKGCDEDDVNDALSREDRGEEFRREDFDYMLKLLDISIAHIEQDLPDYTYTPKYVGPERRRHPLVENVVLNLDPNRKKKKRKG